MNETDNTTKPNEDYIRGTCPECGDYLVSEMKFVPGKGYIVYWNCWAKAQTSNCSYSRQL